MNRLIDTIDLGLSVRNAAQACAGQESQRTRDNAGFITDDVTEQVASDNNTVKLSRLLDHDHGRGVNELVLHLELGELLGHDLRHGLPPQPARREDVGLVQAPHGKRGVVLQSEVGRKAGDTLDLRAGVRLRVHGEAAAVVLLAVAEVDAAGQFADDVEVDAAADFGAERGAVDQRRGGEVAGAEVTECAHLLAQTEEALFGADGASAPFLWVVLLLGSGGGYERVFTYGTANGTEENGIGVLCGVKSFVGKGRSGSIDRCLQGPRKQLAEEMPV